MFKKEASTGVGVGYKLEAEGFRRPTYIENTRTAYINFRGIISKVERAAGESRVFGRWSFDWDTGFGLIVTPSRNRFVIDRNDLLSGEIDGLSTRYMNFLRNSKRLMSQV